eukprot:COSAG01_NODE_23332_length_819_cov_1.302778_1_plen_238_part_10
MQDTTGFVVASTPRPRNYGDGFPEWATLTPSGEYAVNVSKRRNSGVEATTCRVVEPTNEVYELHFLTCAICKQGGADTDYARGDKLEPLGSWWTKGVLAAHARSIAHTTALKEVQPPPPVAPPQPISVAMDAAQQLSAAQQLQTETLRQEQTRAQLGAVVRTVLHQAKNASAFAGLPGLIELQAANGANVPASTSYGGHTSQHSSKDLTLFISKMEKEDITKAVEASSFWTFVVDGSS